MSEEKAQANPSPIHGVLDAYIKHDAIYAIMIKGAWGSGKTHTVKRWIDKQREHKKRVAYVSLYGKTTVEELQKEVFSDVYRSAYNKKVAIGVMSAFVSAAIRYNFDFEQAIKVEKDIQKELAKGGWVFVFDDVERCLIEPQALLGFFNQLLEHGGFHVVILANREEFDIVKEKSDDHTSSDERRILEKVVGEEHLYIPDIPRVIKAFGEKLPSSPQRLILLNTMIVAQEDFQSENLRHAKVVAHQARLLFKEVNQPRFNTMEKGSPDVFKRLWEEYVMFAYLIQLGHLDISSLVNIGPLYRRYEKERSDYRRALMQENKSVNQSKEEGAQALESKSKLETLKRNDFYKAFYREENMVYELTPVTIPVRYAFVEQTLKHFLEEDDACLMKFWLDYFVHRQCHGDDIEAVLELYRRRDNLLNQTFIDKLYKIGAEALQAQISEFMKHTDVSTWKEKEPAWNETLLIRWVRTAAYFLVCADYDKEETIRPSELLERIKGVLEWLETRDLLTTQVNLPFREPAALDVAIEPSFFIEQTSMGLDFAHYRNHYGFLMSQETVQHIEELEGVQEEYALRVYKKLLAHSRRALLSHMEQGRWLDLHMKHGTIPLFNFDDDEARSEYLRQFVDAVKKLTIHQGYNMLYAFEFRLKHMGVSTQEREFIAQWYATYKNEPMDSIQQRLQQRELCRLVEEKGFIEMATSS